MRRFAYALLLLCLWAAPARAQTIISQVHNAPGWIHSNSYSTSGVHHVNNGAGWNESTGKWVPYSRLDAYKLSASSPSPCTSAATQSTTWGTGTAITDGTCKWDWMSVTDYVTLTGWGQDAPAWTAQSYGYREVVAAPDANGVLTQYLNDNNTGCPQPGSAPPVTARACGYQVAGNCNSAVAPPNNPGTDSCTWTARVPITYSSGTSFIPKQTRLAINWMYSTASHNYEADLWNDQQYVMGSNGETSSAFVLEENWSTFNHNVQVVPNPSCGQFSVPVPPTFLCSYNIVAAPGESFIDTLAANSSLPLRYDPSYGVSIVGNVNTANFFINVNRLQMFNPTGTVLGGSGRDADDFIISNNIIEVGTSSAGVGAPWALGDGIHSANNLIISHGPDAIGFESIYPGTISHSTIVNPEGTGNTCLFFKWDWLYWQGQIVADTICAGFAHTNGAIGNQTDTPGYVNYNADPANTNTPHDYSTSPYENGTVNPFVFNSPFTVQWQGPSNNEYAVTGMTYGVSSSGLFTGANDYRIPPTSPLRAAGANYGNIDTVAIGTFQYGVTPEYINYDATDILGTARPATGQDIGAWQTPGAPPATFTLTVTPPSNGTITGTSGINCGGSCTATINSGSTVVLTATANSGYHFNLWNGACSGGISPCSFTMNANQTVAAQFVPNSNPISNRIARLVVHSPSAGGGGSPPLLQMPSGISGNQTVEVGTGTNTISLFLDGSAGHANNQFVVSLSFDGGATYTQITDTVNPMTVTQHTGAAHPQFFIFHGNWGSSTNLTNVKIAGTGSEGLSALWFGSSCCNIFQIYDDVILTYLGPGNIFMGYSTEDGDSGYTPLVWSKCTDTIIPAPPSGDVGSWLDCPPNYNGTESIITGATNNGSTVSPGVLSTIANNGTNISTVLPAGSFFGTTRMWFPGEEIHGQGQGVTVINGKHIAPFQGKALFDWETHQMTMTDMSITGAQIGGGADNIGSAFNAGCVFLAEDNYLFDNVEFSNCQDGIRGGAVSTGLPIVINNSYFHDNGARNARTHAIYLAGGTLGLVNNVRSVAGDKAGYAIKMRFPTIVNGGYYESCSDPTAFACAGAMDFPNGGNIDIQGMNTLTVGGTIHTGDVLTMTFQHLSDTPIVVTSTVAAGPPTAQVATNALLAALQASSALKTAGWAFHASMPVGGNGTIPNAIDLYAPTRLVDWTITPTVTGTGHTTTLVETATPVTIALTSNAIVANGSTQIIKCQEEFSDAPCVMNLNNIIIDNRNSNAPRIAVGQWDATPGMAGTVLNITNCHYTGGIAPQITSNWATVNGACVTP